MDENLIIEEWIQSNGGKPDWKAIAAHLGYKEAEAEKLRQRYKHYREKRGDFEQKRDRYKAKIEINGDNSRVIDVLVALTDEEAKDPNAVLDKLGYPPAEWELIKLEISLWQSMKSHKIGGGTQELMSVRARIEPRNPSKIALEDIDEHFKDYTPPKLAPRAKRKKQEGLLLEVVLGDMHLDGNNNGNITKRVENTLDGIEQINMDISEIVLVPIGDIFHYDSYQKTTTGGTKIDSGGMGHQKMFDLGLDLLKIAVERLKRIAPVKLMFVPGNHDYTYSYMLLKAVECYYREDENVNVDCGHHPRKAVLWGENLIVWAHGEVAKTRISDLPQVEFREAFGKAGCVELHAGHLHSQQAFEKGGVIVRYLPAIASPTEWEIKEGFVGSLRGTMCYLWDKKPGYVANYQIRP